MSRPLQYVQIPQGATFLDADTQKTSLPSPSSTGSPTTPQADVVRLTTSPTTRAATDGSHHSNRSVHSGTSHTSTVVNNLLTQVLSLPTPPVDLEKPPSTKEAHPLLTNSASLSLPTTTQAFRRFVARAGAIFWLQDRAEEILLWRRGWKYTTTYLAGYALVCFFPHLVLTAPPAIILAIALANSHREFGDEDADEIANAAIKKSSKSRTPLGPIPPFPPLAAEGSAQWFAHVQAIQNVLAAVSDGYDALIPFTPYFIFPSPTLIVHLVGFILLSLFLPLFIPPHLLFLTIGLTPFILTHPHLRALIPYLMRSYSKTWRMGIQRLIDDDRLEERHWMDTHGMQEVELYENERWNADRRSWGKEFLGVDKERQGWTRGADGWSSVGAEGHVSNLTFALEPGWSFVETEDWREDLHASWAIVGADQDGWVYTNDSWQNPQPQPSEELLSSSTSTHGGMTRRRRWKRRIYYSSVVLSHIK